MSIKILPNELTKTYLNGIIFNNIVQYNGLLGWNRCAMKFVFIVDTNQSSFIKYSMCEPIRKYDTLEWHLLSGCKLKFNTYSLFWSVNVFKVDYEWHFSDSLVCGLMLTCTMLSQSYSPTCYLLDAPLVLIFTGNVQFYLSGFCRYIYSRYKTSEMNSLLKQGQAVTRVQWAASTTSFGWPGVSENLFRVPRHAGYTAWTQILEQLETS